MGARGGILRNMPLIMSISTVNPGSVHRFERRIALQIIRYGQTPFISMLELTATPVNQNKTLIFTTHGFSIRSASTSAASRCFVHRALWGGRISIGSTMVGDIKS